MNILDLLIGKKVSVKTDVGVDVPLGIKHVEERRHSRDLEPATRENDWYPRSENWTTIEVIFDNGYRKSYANLSEINIIE